ncbi:MAG: hypothetical protein Q9203_002398 [Teloschistes exilis]
MPTPDQGVPAFRRQLEIVREYRSIKTIHPAVKAFQQSEADQRMLDTVLNHQYKLMLGRSRDVADCEITVFEAAFMVLMQHVENHCGALYLFVEEILGLKLVAQPQKQEVLKQALKFHTLLLHLATSNVDHDISKMYPTPSKETSSTYNRLDGYDYGETTVSESINASVFHPDPPMSRREDTRSASLKEEDRVKKTDEFRRTAKKGTSSSTADFDPKLGFSDKANPNLASHMHNPRLKKLFSIYRIAREEFHTTDPSSDEYLTNTKFLRDTAENCIQYLSSINPGDARLQELKQTFLEASTMTTNKLGGLRRRFEYDWRDTPKGPSLPTPMSRKEKKKLSRLQRWSYDGQGQSGAAS